ncbi:transcriptional antiterminator, BglG family [Gracilibacillus kekensis]|uniref:Transcriptional antiterminator, BglG family n=1 Tax=Gracilibacillus kekensis TaxID=1027249 RepID=A0A1M7QS84_9BACI|nr:PRD domain-containing protein [Gracilibacillus kekensis]SHN34557.1 transcriptional antiterminator, BglG family [Gracilibacillus kekensis]
MKLKKIFNNNAVLVLDQDKEKVAIGNGIAFGKRKNDLINTNKIEKLFVMKENIKLQQLLSRIPEEHFLISEEIISYAEHYLGTKLSEHIHIVLSDHVSFAIERIQEGIHLPNKLLNEIKILYRNEYDIGVWAVQHIREEYNIDVPIDEAAHIALHIHTMKLQGGDYRQTIRHTAIVREMMLFLLEEMNMNIKEDDISYQRLVTHLHFTLSRVNQYELHEMDEEMFRVIKNKFSTSYNLTLKVTEGITSKYGIQFPPSELGYITLHIERLKKC